MRMHPADFLPAGALVTPTATPLPTRHFPVLFLSDLHLGSRACREDLLLSFLQAHTADVIYLVGDIIDTWLPLGAHWTAGQQQILAILFDRAKRGARLVFTPGNHDAFFRRFIGHSMLGIEIHDQVLHTAADGRRYLVVHGDETDLFDARFPKLSRLSTRLDSAMRGLIGWINTGRQRRGLPKSNLAERIVKRFNDMIRAAADRLGRARNGKCHSAAAFYGIGGQASAYGLCTSRLSVRRHKTHAAKASRWA